MRYCLLYENDRWYWVAVQDVAAAKKYLEAIKSGVQSEAPDSLWKIEAGIDGFTFENPEETV